MNLSLGKDGILHPLNLRVATDGSKMPCGNHPDNVHVLELWGAPQEGSNDFYEEKVEMIRSTIPLAEGLHAIRYDSTGVSHRVKAVCAPQIIVSSPTIVKILVTFKEA